MGFFSTRKRNTVNGNDSATEILLKVALNTIKRTNETGKN
jgi:hypothetical protein